MGDNLWSYLIAHDGSITDAELRSVLDRMPTITNWYTCMSHSAFVVSASSATELTRALRAELGTMRFLVVDLHGDRNGVLPKQAWTFIRNPRPPRKIIIRKTT